jgi:hypothetical protein
MVAAEWFLLNFPKAKPLRSSAEFKAKLFASQDLQFSNVF